MELVGKKRCAGKSENAGAATPLPPTKSQGGGKKKKKEENEPRRDERHRRRGRFLEMELVQKKRYAGKSQNAGAATPLPPKQRRGKKKQEKRKRKKRTKSEKGDSKCPWGNAHHAGERPGGGFLKWNWKGNRGKIRKRGKEKEELVTK